MDIKLHWCNFALALWACTPRGGEWLRKRFGTTNVTVHCSYEPIMRELAQTGLAIGGDVPVV